MLQLIKDHWGHISHSIADTMINFKTVGATVVTGVGAVTVKVTEPQPVVVDVDEWSAYAVIFSATATGLFMLSNFVFNLIKIRKELKEVDKCD